MTYWLNGCLRDSGEPAIPADDPARMSSDLTGILKRPHEIDADLLLKISSADRKNKNHTI